MLDLNDAGPQQLPEHEQTQEQRHRYVPTAVARQAVQGREADAVRGLGIQWHGRDHIHCPYPDHPDKDPSWRMMDNGNAVCTCTPSHSVFDVAMRLEGLSFEDAKIRIIQVIGREDLIVDPSAEKPNSKGLTLEEYSAAKKLPVDFLHKIGVRQTSYGQIPAAVRTPYFRLNGEPSMRFRVALTGEKKHLWRKGDKACLYGESNAAYLKDVDSAVIVEGESDTQTLWLHGIPAFGLPGAGNWREDRDARLFDGVPVIYVVVEPDKGGDATMKWLARSLIAPRARLIRLPAATKDPSALYLSNQEGFLEAFRTYMDAAEPFPTEEIKPAHGTNHQVRPEIIVVAGSLHDAADEGLDAMKMMGVKFYQRDKSMVRVALIKAKASDGATITTPGIVPVKLPMLRRALGQSAKWQKYNKEGDLMNIDPPKDVVEQIGEMVGEWPFPPLVGVISVPILRPDGTLLLEEGYDEATGFALFAPPKMPPIPAKPTMADAEAALDVLCDLMREFPFVDEPSKAVSLSMLLTPVLRAGLPPAVPMHLVTKPAPGTGGSYLADIASAIATGNRCPVMSISQNPEETEKRLIGAAISGSPIIALDNSNAPLQGDFLCQVTERPLLELRPLGQSPLLKVANAFTVFANGNQASVTQDLVRRTITCSLDANMESPWTRKFEQDPLAMVLSDRGRYIAACLTIVRAYIVAGRPGKPQPLASFPSWSDTVRGALMWLGCLDPIITTSAAQMQDEPRQQRAALFKAWAAEYVINTGVLTSDLIAAAEEIHPPSIKEGAPTGWKRPTLHDTLLSIASQRGSPTKIDSIRLGKWLKHNTNNIAGVLKLTSDRSDAYRPRWRLDTVR